MSKKAPYSENEILRLLELYRENKMVLQSSFKSTVTNQKKQQLWQHIVDEVNVVGMRNRTVKEVTHKWKDIKAQAKKDLSARKNPKTGGGKPAKEGAYTEVILEIIGDDAPSLNGVPGGGLESSIEQETCSAEEHSAFNSTNDEAADQSLKQTAETSNSHFDDDDALETLPDPPRKKTKLPKERDESDLSRDELHRILLREEITKVRLETSKIELEKIKLELEIRKLQEEELARHRYTTSTEQLTYMNV